MIPLFKVYIRPGFSDSLNATLQSGYLTQGPKVEEFEYLLRRFLDVPYVLTVNSATSGLQLASVLAGLDHDSYAISTPMTCTATNTAILSTGANIIWADIDPNTGNISVESVKTILETSKHNIKAVMCVDWAGLPCDYEELFDITSKYGIKIIRDAAHAWGSTYQGVKVPEYIDYTVYSFQAIKHLTTADGGALICSSLTDHVSGKKLRWYGIDREVPQKDMRCETNIDVAGWKYHMNDVNATLGIHQMGETNKIIVAHQYNASVYNLNFHSLQGVSIQATHRDARKYDSSYWIYSILVEEYKNDKLIALLGDRGIQASRVHSKNDVHGMLKNAIVYHDLIGLNKFSSTQLNIPCGWWVTVDDQEKIINTVKECVNLL